MALRLPTTLPGLFGRSRWDRAGVGLSVITADTPQVNAQFAFVQFFNNDLYGRPLGVLAEVATFNQGNTDLPHTFVKGTTGSLATSGVSIWLGAARQPGQMYTGSVAVGPPNQSLLSPGRGANTYSLVGKAPIWIVPPQWSLQVTLTTATIGWNLTLWYIVMSRLP